MRRLSFCLAVVVTVRAFGAPTYTQDIKPILDKRCAECHDSLSHDPDLTSFPFPTEKYPDQNTVVSRILARTKAQSMPPGNRPKLSQPEIDKIQQWKDGGLPE